MLFTQPAPFFSDLTHLLKRYLQLDTERSEQLMHNQNIQKEVLLFTQSAPSLRADDAEDVNCNNTGCEMPAFFKCTQLMRASSFVANLNST